MKRIENYETVQASSGEFARPTAGARLLMLKMFLWTAKKKAKAIILL